ncbi:unnamed protein product [Euphydryas editha]|uniref:Major facilitator superfamily (MFS) profile domain-containing protein n=1 Tax=Euphydryas editha TaxID=104508 RepID=A0AAU9TK41_EUPED|nr:unnamed protein product [Euphydryas editha]
MKPERCEMNMNQKIPEIKNDKDMKSLTISNQVSNEKVYTCEEAIDLTGTGWYIYSLVAVLAFAFEGMALDMFGLSVVVTSACDLELTRSQQSILLSMPLLGSVISAYPWGYIADTQGRLKGLKISLWGSFILATLSAFSPNWIVLAVLRLGSSSFSSGIQSLSLTLLGESCSSKIKGPSLIAVVSLIFYTFGIYSACGYFILGLEFAYDLGFIVFSPWRLLGLVLAIPLGVSAISSIFYYESPKFLLNTGDEKNALEILRKISERNGIKANKYPVQKVVFNETIILNKDIPFLQSLLDQIVPLFKPPHLYRTVQLFFITSVIYSSNNGFYSWMPFLADKLNSGLEGNANSSSFCEMVSNYQELNKTSTCIITVSEFTVWISLMQGTMYTLLNLVLSWFSWRKKAVNITIISISVISGVCIPFANGLILSVSLYFSFLVNCLCIPIVFSYYVDIFPTSYRGMATCLGVMAARLSALVGTNIVGAYLVNHCVGSFYSWSAFIMCGVIASIFLPPDNPKKLC